MVHDVIEKRIPTPDGSGVNTYYFDHNGNYIKNAWHDDDNEKTYFKSDGKQAIYEWVKATDGQWYYFDDSDHMVHDCVKEGIATLNGSGKNNYYFDHNGHYEVNTWYKNKDNNWNYFKLDGQQAYEEWVKALDGKWYYFDYDGNMAHDGWLGTNCKNRWLTYYFDHNGH